MKITKFWPLLAAGAVLGAAYALLDLVTPRPADPAPAEVGPCYFCGEPGQWCPNCRVYKCPRHGGPAFAVAGAITKATGLENWHGGEHEDSRP
jgi:hypothetical protein